MIQLSTILAGLLLVTAAPGFAENQSPASKNGGDDSSWQAMQSLIGQWDGDLGGQPGQATGGSFTITSDLQGRALVRRSFAEFPATKDRPAFRHDDLTIVYQGAAGSAPRATYYDSEGHVIEYTVSVSSGGRRIEWLSAVRPAEPRFRFTYAFTSPTTMNVRFEIAPPGQPDKFTTHVEGSVRKAVTEPRR
jgi:hypothetical protein